MSSTANPNPSYNKYMQDLKLDKLVKQKLPDMAQVKPPTKSAIEIMIKNLRAHAKTVR